MTAKKKPYFLSISVSSEKDLHSLLSVIIELIRVKKANDIVYININTEPDYVVVWVNECSRGLARELKKKIKAACPDLVVSARQYNKEKLLVEVEL